MAVRSPLIAAMRALAAVLLLQSAAYAQDVKVPAQAPAAGQKQSVPDGQTPPDGQRPPEGQTPPKIEASTPRNCVSVTGEFKGKGPAGTFVIRLQNSCETGGDVPSTPT